MTAISAFIDIGGSSVKVTIRDNSVGKILTYEIGTTPKVQGSHISLNPDELFATVIQVMNKSVEGLRAGLKVKRIYISSLRQGFCLISNKKELTPIFLNSDTSGEMARADIEKYGLRRIYEETGHWFAPQLTLPKLINLMRVQPELVKQNTKLLFVHDWLAWKFTQEIVTEMTLVSAGQMAKLSDKGVHAELLDFFGIPEDILPKPHKFGTSLGLISAQPLLTLSSLWSDAEVVVGGGDSHFLHMGASLNQARKVVVSAGSSTPISLLSTSMGTSTVLQPWKSTSFEDSMYFLEGNLGYPGSFFGWLNKNASKPISLGALSLANISNAPAVFGSCNMWNEEKWESRPPFSILGDFSKSNTNEIALGLMLDYSFALANQISALLSDGFEVDQVILTGGGASLQLQLILDSLLDIPVGKIASDDAISNLFTMLDGEQRDLLGFGNSTLTLDSETSAFLKSKAKNHALIYAQLEGTREVLENAS